MSVKIEVEKRDKEGARQEKARNASKRFSKISLWVSISRLIRLTSCVEIEDFPRAVNRKSEMSRYCSPRTVAQSAWYTKIGGTLHGNGVGWTLALAMDKDAYNFVRLCDVHLPLTVRMWVLHLVFSAL